MNTSPPCTWVYHHCSDSNQNLAELGVLDTFTQVKFDSNRLTLVWNSRIYQGRIPGGGVIGYLRPVGLDFKNRLRFRNDTRAIIDSLDSFYPAFPLSVLILRG